MKDSIDFISVSEAAKFYLNRGYRAIPVPFGKKAPIIKGWQKKRLTIEDVPTLFPDDTNIGLLLGEPSKGLVDADLDCVEARSLAAIFLPSTGMIHGRAGNPNSHYWYVCSPVPRTKKWVDPNKPEEERGTLLEVRSTGGQTLVPPSYHPSGEQLAWNYLGEPGTVTSEELEKCCSMIAAGALLARYWPSEGSRQDAALALSGGLLGAGWSEDRVADFILRVAETAGDEEAKQRAAVVKYTAEKLASSEPVTGWPRQSELLGEKTVTTVKKWLGIKTRQNISGSPYKVENGVIVYEKMTNNGSVTIPLCNFIATVTGEVVKDDGLETTTFFEISGKMADGRVLLPANVSASEFGGMNWTLKNWGIRAVINAGQSSKDHLRAAIQQLSGDVPQQIVYTHLGWRKIEGGWIYLNAGGAIGEKGLLADIRVSMEGRLTGYLLPDPPLDSVEVLQTSLAILELVSKEKAWPLLAAVYRAPLGEPLRSEVNLFYAGGTGAQKSSLAAIAQAHFGASFDLRNLPGDWFSTANSMEKLAFLAKDALITFDDFCPAGTAKDVQALHKTADRLLRGNANQSGRARMKADGNLRPSYVPRGIILATGEDVPTGASLLARTLVVEIQRGDVDLDKLTAMQKAAAEGQLSVAMAAYIKWLAPRLNNLKDTLSKRYQEIRQEIRGLETWHHDKTPSLLADLMLGTETFLRFAAEVGAVTMTQAPELRQQCLQSFVALGRHQADFQKSDDLVNRFLNLLGAVFNSYRGHLADPESDDYSENLHLFGWRNIVVGVDRDGNEKSYWRAEGPRLGWVDKTSLSLEPEATIGVVQELAKSQGGTLAIKPKTLWKRMAERGLIVDKRKDRNTTRITVRGRRIEVIALDQSILEKYMDSMYSQNRPNRPNRPQDSEKPDNPKSSEPIH